MKQFLFIISLLASFSISYAQRPGPPPHRGIPPHIRLKMNEFIDRRLPLNSDEAKKFDPVFQEYLQAWEKNIQESKDDPLMLEKKLADLRLDYRNKFRAIIGDQRSNTVFILQRDFIKEVRALQKERVLRKPI